MRILVVEDEPAAAAVLATGLREHAYAVDVAADGSLALEQASISDHLYRGSSSSLVVDLSRVYPPFMLSSVRWSRARPF